MTTFVSSATNWVAGALEMPDAWIAKGAELTSLVVAPAYEPFDALAGPSIRTAFANLGLPKHPMSAKLPLMEPVPVVFSVVGYLVTLAILYAVGKGLGKLSMRSFATVHNLFLFLLSLYMCVGIAATAVASGFSVWNNAVQESSPTQPNPNAWRMAKLVWIF